MRWSMSMYEGNVMMGLPCKAKIKESTELTDG